jgi:hypothetical protein
MESFVKKYRRKRDGATVNADLVNAVTVDGSGEAHPSPYWCVPTADGCDDFTPAEFEAEFEEVADD